MNEETKKLFYEALAAASQDLFDAEDALLKFTKACGIEDRIAMAILRVGKAQQKAAMMKELKKQTESMIHWVEQS